MKNWIIALALVSAPAFAAEQQQEQQYPTSGLACTIAYSKPGALSTYTLSDSSWTVAGKTIEGKARVNENGSPGAKAANSIKISNIKVDGEQFWNIKVLDGATGKAIGVFSFPPEGGMKASFEVNAIDDETEDPAEFNQLDVTCAFTYFAG